MENTNKMKNLTNDLKAFEQMMKEQRKENHYPEIEFEIDTEEDSPADILLQASGMLMDCSVMVAKAAFLVGLMEAETDEDDEDEIIYTEHETELVVGSTDEVLDAGFTFDEDSPEGIFDDEFGSESADDEV